MAGAKDIQIPPAKVIVYNSLNPHIQHVKKHPAVANTIAEMTVFVERVMLLNFLSCPKA